MFKLSQRSIDRLEGVHPDCIKVINRALQISPVDFGIPEYGGLRSAIEQKQLHDQGLSECDGYIDISNHQTGNAFDVFAYVDGKASWKPLHLAQVACAVLQAASELNIKLRWGGHFKPFKVTNGVKHGWDMPHFERVV